jgi:hypothetical protein
VARFANDLLTVIPFSANLGDHNHTSMTYKVALAAGVQVQFVLEDTAGDEAWTGNVRSDSLCFD